VSLNCFRLRHLRSLILDHRLDLLLAEHLQHVNSGKRSAPKHIIVRNKHKCNQYVLEMHHKQNKAAKKLAILKDPKPHHVLEQGQMQYIY
jgi:hypothetical protein